MIEKLGTMSAGASTIAQREFLTFTLGPEEYGLEILKVQEIRSYDTVTTIPNAPAFLKGVINLRGVIVPIIDMRMKFNASFKFRVGNALHFRRLMRRDCAFPLQ